jgi:hypothetical protein
MTERSSLASLTPAMKARGFKYEGRSSENWLKFKGSLTAAGAQHDARVGVDPSGKELPLITVALPVGAPQVLAHIGAGGQICYAASGSVTLDIFDIAGQTLASIDRAAQVLDLSLRGEMMQDLEDEFFAFWHGPVCFLDVSAAAPAALSVLFVGPQDDRSVFVSSDSARTRLKIQAMHLQESSEVGNVAFRVHSAVKPRPMQGTWPPPTMAELLKWQGLLGGATRRNIERRMLVAIAAGRKGAICVVDAPASQYAFLASFPAEAGAGASTRGEAARKRLYAAAVMPLMVVRVDDEYISQRNTPGRATLAGKRIALIGCGTIGGFLAELLVKAGAGLAKGELLLIDDDDLMPQNVGRHRLGLNYALQKKATGLKVELGAGAPSSNIRDLVVRAEEVDLSRVELIVNATGEEALGHYLTRKLTDSGVFVPTLTVWVDGPGVAVRGLLRDSPAAACGRCMADEHRTPLYPAVKGELPVELAGHGCESLYVPFPATVSVQAACLAAEMIADWRAGSPAPRLRTKITRPGFAKCTPDGDIARLEACPACST